MSKDDMKSELVWKNRWANINIPLLLKQYEEAYELKKKYPGGYWCKVSDKSLEHAKARYTINFMAYYTNQSVPEFWSVYKSYSDFGCTQEGEREDNCLVDFQYHTPYEPQESKPYMKTTLQDYLFDPDINTIEMDERTNLAEVLNTQIALIKRARSYMEVCMDLAVDGLDGVPFDLKIPKNAKKGVRRRWHQLIAKIDELQIFILEQVNNYLPLANIKLPDGANKPEFLIDAEGHIILTYYTTECCNSHSQRVLKFDDYIEIKCKND